MLQALSQVQGIQREQTLTLADSWGVFTYFWQFGHISGSCYIFPSWTKEGIWFLCPYPPPPFFTTKYPFFPWSLIPHSLGVSSKSPLSESPHSKFSPSSYREPDLMREFLLVLAVLGCLSSVPGWAILLEVSGLFRLYIFWWHDESGWIWDATSLPTPCH